MGLLQQKGITSLGGGSSASGSGMLQRAGVTTISQSKSPSKPKITSTPTKKVDTKVAVAKPKVPEKKGFLAQAAETVKKIGNNIKISFTAPKVSAPLPQQVFDKQPALDRSKQVILKPNQKKLEPGQLKRLGLKLQIGGEQFKGNIKNTAALVVSQLEQEGRKNEKKFKELAKKHPKIYTKEFFREREESLQGYSQTADKIRASAQKNFDKAEGVRKANFKVDNRKFLDKARDPQWIAESVAETLPNLLGSIGVAIVTTAVTKNPIAGYTAAFGSSYAQEAGAAYQDAKNYGVDKKTAEKVAVQVGLGAGLLDAFPIANLLNRGPQGKAIKNKIIKEITRKVVYQAALESGTESLQEIVANAAAKTYDENRDYFAGVPESALIGGILGGGSEVGAMSFDKIISEGEKTPQQAIGEVMKNNKDKTPEGREIIKAALEAQQRGENIVIEKAVPEKFYTPAKNLSSNDRAVETKFGKYLTDNYEKAKADYIKEFGNVLNTDNARELSPDYRSDRSRLSKAVHEPASAFIKKLYSEQVSIPDPKGINEVVFTAGGTGGGKTSAIVNAKKSLQDTQIVYDTNLNTYPAAVEKIDHALNSGKSVIVNYVHREPIESLVNGAIPRANRMGRTVPIENHVDTHIGALETVFKLKDHYKDNPNFTLHVIDNTSGKNKAKLSSLDLLKNLEYNKGELTSKSLAEVQKAYEQGQISEAVYEGFTGQQPEETGRSSSQSSRGEPKQPQVKTPEELLQEEADKSLLTSDQAVEQETKDTPHTQKVRGELESTQEDIELRRQENETKKSILDQFTPRQIQAMRAMKRSINSRVNKGMDTETVMETQSYKTHIWDIMAAIGTDSESEAIRYVNEDLPDPLVRASTREELQKIKVLRSHLAPKEVTAPKGQLPVGEGKPKASKLEARMKGILEDATPEQIEELGLSTFNQMNKKEMIEKAAQYVAENPEEALAVVRGKKEAPAGLIPEAIYIALVSRAETDLTLATKLASLQASALGQRISILSELNRNSPVKLLNEVYKIRVEEFKKRYKSRSYSEVQERVVTRIRDQVKRPDKYDWNSFLKTIEC